MSTKIEWTRNADGTPGKTWNPITGCTQVSPGCRNCYAERMAKRLRGRHGYPADEPFRVTAHADRLYTPWHWKRPRHIFVCSMGDLFHGHVSNELIADIFNVMCDSRSEQHTFQVLTKRPQRALQWLEWLGENEPGNTPLGVTLEVCGHFGRNIWFGISAEDQKRADERIPLLLKIPAAVRFVSLEPLLGPIHLGMATPCDRDCAEYQDAECPGTSGPCIMQRHLDWVIVGGESGPGARPMHPFWVRSIRDQCVAANVPFFFKQWGEWVPFSAGARYEDGEEFGGECGGPTSLADFRGGEGESPITCCARGGGCGETGRRVQYREERTHRWGRGNTLWMQYIRIGKKRAGCLLDGRKWLQKPSN